MAGILTDNRRLYDIATRKQIYVEGIKAQQSREFNFVLAELSVELTKLFSRIKYATLDGMTKAELNNFILSLRKSQQRIYSSYTEQLMKQLRAFMGVDMSLTRRVYATAWTGIDGDEAKTALDDDEALNVIKTENKQNAFIPLFGIAGATDDPRLWSVVINAPIPANGLYLLPFVKTFAISAQASVENLVRKGWANGWTVAETAAEINGNTQNKQGTTNQLQRIAAQGAAVTATATQHVTSIVSAAIISTLFGAYAWYSVLDQSTTDICRERNLKVFKFGVGPIPPAHIRCRSHIAPIVGNTNAVAGETLYTWSMRQPDDVQDEMLGASQAKELRSGTLKAKDLGSLKNAEPLSIDEYEEKVNVILQS